MSDIEKPVVAPDVSSNGETEAFYDPDAGLSEEERKKIVRPSTTTPLDLPSHY
jgi:hypothetical protein